MATDKNILLSKAFFAENTSNPPAALKSFIRHLNLILAPLMNGEAEE